MKQITLLYTKFKTKQAMFVCLRSLWAYFACCGFWQRTPIWPKTADFDSLGYFCQGYPPL